MPTPATTVRRRARLAAAIACLVPVVAAAQTPPARPTGASSEPAPNRAAGISLAVLRFNNGAIGKANAELEPLAFGIPEVLMAELATDTRIKLFERARLDDLVREQKLAASGTVDEATAAQMGKLLGVRHVVFGAFMGARGDSVRVIARLVNVETNAVEAVVTEQDHVDNVLPMLAAAAQGLAKGIPGLTVAGRSRASLVADAPTAPFAAVMAFSKALAAMAAGDGAKARGLLLEAIAAAPDWRQPQKALDELVKGRKAPGQ